MDADTSLRAPRSSTVRRVGRVEDGHTEARQRDDGGRRAGAGQRDEAGQAEGGSEKVLIELSPAQVDRVIRSAADGGSISILLSGLRDVREVLAREPRQLEDSRLSRSLLAGLLMLASFPTDGSYLGNAEIARMLDMNPSTTHRYVSTLVAVGLLERDPSTRRYRLV
jgi:hypothetical protein